MGAVAGGALLGRYRWRTGVFWTLAECFRLCFGSDGDWVASIVIGDFDA